MRELINALLQHVALAASLRHDGQGLPRSPSPILALLAVVSLSLEYAFSVQAFPEEDSYGGPLAFLLGKALTFGLLGLVGPALLRAGTPSLILSVWMLCAIPPGLFFLLAGALGASPPSFLFSLWLLASSFLALLRIQRRESAEPPASP